jgi:hypothetical protein
MVSTMNGSGPHTAAPAWQARADELTAKWQARVRERQQAQIDVLASAQPVEVNLPSGLQVLAIRAHIISLKEAGRIPDAITPYVLNLLKIGQEQDEKSVQKHIDDTEDDAVKMLDAVWLATVVAPSFTSDLVPEDGSVPMRQVDPIDKVALFNWAQGVEDHLSIFRGPGNAGGTRPDGSAVQHPSSDYVRRRSVSGATPGVPTAAGDVLHGNDRRRPSQTDEGRGSQGARSTGEGQHDQTSSGVDVSAGHRSGRTAGGRKRRIK